MTDRTRQAAVITFRVWGTPKGQPRPRAFAHQGRVRVYTPGTAEAWKSQIAQAAQPWHGARIAGPVFLKVEFLMPRPRAHVRRDGSVRPSAPGWHTTRPDIDNLLKAVLDALTTIGLWADDAAITEIIAQKRYATGTEPGAIISITTSHGGIPHDSHRSRTSQKPRKTQEFQWSQESRETSCAAHAGT